MWRDVIPGVRQPEVLEPVDCDESGPPGDGLSNSLLSARPGSPEYAPTAAPWPELDPGFTRERATIDPYVPTFEYEAPADGATYVFTPRTLIRSLYVVMLTSQPATIETDSGRIYSFTGGFSGVLWLAPTTTIRVAATAAATGSILLYAFPKRVPPVVGSGFNFPAPVGANVNPSAGAPVALSSPPATLTANASTLLTFASTVRHIEIQNNTTDTKGVEFDGTTATAGSYQVPPGGTYSADVSTTQVALYGTLASALNGSSAGNVVVRGRA